MKKIFFCIFIMFGLINTGNAQNMPDLTYKNISLKNKISYDSETNVWSNKINKKNKNYFIKVKGFGDYFDYLDSDKNFAFTTNCEYEFIYNNGFYGYSNRDMKFYEFIYDNNKIIKRTLSKEEVQEILPEYKIVSFSQFSPKTNSLKIKKNIGELKILLYNDTENSYEKYTFTSGNSKFEQYDLRGFLTVQKPGMIQFSRLGEKDDKNWYILLIR